MALIAMGVLALLAWGQARKAKVSADLALREQGRAEAGERDARRLHYIANMNLAQQTSETEQRGALNLVGGNKLLPRTRV